MVEIHPIRLDRAPTRTVDFLGQWVHAEGRDGGGYMIPTIPVRGQEKNIDRDDLQVLPGVMSSREVETEIVLLNPIDVAVQARITVSSATGMVVDGGWFTIEPWTAWRSPLSDALPRVRGCSPRTAESAAPPSTPRTRSCPTSASAAAAGR